MSEPLKCEIERGKGGQCACSLVTASGGRCPYGPTRPTFAEAFPYLTTPPVPVCATPDAADRTEGEQQ